MTANATAADIEAGVWVRFPSWDAWRYVQAARHTPFDPAEPRTTGFVQYDCPRYGGFAEHDRPCRLVRITPEAVTT